MSSDGKNSKWPLCKFKDIFGSPGKGIHKDRIFGMASFDLIGTVIIAIILAFVSKSSFLFMFFNIMMLSVFVHLLFCVDTTLTRQVSSILGFRPKAKN